MPNPETPSKQPKPFGVTLAECHLESEYKNFVILGLKQEGQDVKVKIHASVDNDMVLNVLSNHLRAVVKRSKQKP